MQDLRLIGVHEDGLHLLLANSDGERFSVPLDDALRAAARQDRPRLGQLQIAMDGGLRPRDVQAMVRAGASAEDVAERAGWSVEKVRKYEGPILAERIHVADLAREVRLRPRGSGSSGSSAATLSARVTERMRDRGVDPDTGTWDAWRLPETDRWTVSLTFAAGGRQRQAAWSFDPTSRVVEAEDDESRWLSEDEPAAGPLTSPQAGAARGGAARAGGATAANRATDVYDVEAEGGVVGRRRPPPAVAPTDEPLDLMTAMRERSTVRGRRGARRKAPPTSPAALPLDTGTGEVDSGPLDPGHPDAGRTDALPIAEIDFDPVVDAPPPPAHTHPDDDPEVGGAGRDLQVTTADRTDEGTRHTGSTAYAGSSRAEVIGQPTAPGSATPEDDPTPDDGAPDDGAPDDGAPDDVAEAPAATPRRPATPARKGRPTVPSWDDIMFGGSRD